jgi:Ca2+/Na+ antiporter
MKIGKKTFVSISILLLAVVGGFVYFFKKPDLLNGIDIIIFILIIAIGFMALLKTYKKDKDKREGFPADDELSNLIKYKSGYYSYLGSMGMWFIIFIFKDKFPDTETMLGVGMLMSALILLVIEYFVRKDFSEK